MKGDQIDREGWSVYSKYTKILPHVDYYLARENLDSFKSKNNEPVGVLMNAWWMWEKWNWPPAECIYPYMISMHINNYGIRRKSSPIQTEWLHKNRGLLEERNKFKKERDELKKKIEEMNELIKNKEKKIEQLIEKYENIKMKDYLKICYKKIKGFIGK